MHYINGAYYPISIIMKYISLLCVALLISASSNPISAQIQPTGCPTYSYWNGQPVNDGSQITAVTGVGPYSCCTAYAPEGTYLYFDGSEYINNELPDDPNCLLGTAAGQDSSWNDSYGLKGRGTIVNPTNIFLDMKVFETRFSTTLGFLQDFEEPEFVFGGGKFRFHSFYIDNGTTVRVTNNTQIEIKGQLKINSGQLIIEPGSSVKLLANSNETAATHLYNGGSIEGEITKQIFYKRKSTTDVNTTTGEEIYSRFNFNPGLYNVDMDQVARSFQNALDIEYVDGSTDKPTVQIGAWVNDTIYEDYSFFADQKYLSPSSSLELPDFEYPVSLGSNTYNTFEDTAYNNSGINWYRFTPNEGAAVLPLYTNTDNTQDDFFNDPQFLGYSSSGLVSDFSNISKTNPSFMGPWIVSVYNANPNITEFVIEVVGNQVTSAQSVFNIKNIASSTIPTTLSVSDAPLTFTYQVSTGEYPPFLPLAPLDYTLLVTPADTSDQGVITPADTIPFGGLYTQDYGVKNYSAGWYRYVPMTGLNFYPNTTGNYMLTERLGLAYHYAAPYSEHAFYDTRLLVPEMKEREYSFHTFSSNGSTINATIADHSSSARLPIIANFLAIEDPVTDVAPATDVLVDIYNIPDIPVYTGIGDTIHPYDSWALNLNNPMNYFQYLGQDIFMSTGFTQVDKTWLDGGPASNQWTAPIVNDYAGSNPINTYDLSEVQKIDDKISQLSFKNGREPNYDIEYNVIKDAAYWEEQNKFSLLTLHGVTSANDTIRLSAIPVAWGEQYGMNYYVGDSANINSDLFLYGVDRFETSIGVDPGFHFINKSPKAVNRMAGAHSRDYAIALDTLYLIFNSEMYEAPVGEEFVSFYIDNPITQDPFFDGQFAWHYTFQNPAWPNFVLNNSVQTLNTINYTEAVPTSGNPEQFKGDIVTFTSNPIAGDFNGDGQVTTSDLLVLLGYFGGEDQGNLGIFGGDFNGDGSITTSDLLSFLSFFGQTLEDWVGLSGESPVSINERRIKHLLADRNNDHYPYDVSLYPGWDSQQLAWYSGLNKANVTVFVTDNYGWVVYKNNLGEIPTGIRLQNKFPSTQEILDSGIGTGLTAYPEGYNIRLLFPRQTVPGFTDPIDVICLGCKDPDTPINLQVNPVFTVN